VQCLGTATIVDTHEDRLNGTDEWQLPLRSRDGLRARRPAPKLSLCSHPVTTTTTTTFLSLSLSQPPSPPRSVMAATSSSTVRAPFGLHPVKSLGSCST
jgi:hypothetical protein